MAVPIMCLTALFLLAWVIYLKLQVGELMKQNEKLIALLRQHAKDRLKGTDSLEETKVPSHWPRWMR
jgi:hypothetical protein